jgi:hypothetical protein
MPKRHLLLKGLSERKLEGAQENLQVAGCGRIGVQAGKALFEADHSFLLLREFAAHVQRGGRLYESFKLFQESKPGGREAAVRVIFEIAFQQDHHTRDSWVLLTLIQLTKPVFASANNTFHNEVSFFRRV